MKEKYIMAHMEVAEVYAKLSSAKRLQVGAIVVKDNRVISIGYNGMPSGWSNECEENILIHEENNVYTTTKTKPEVLHDETNAIAKLARSNESGLDADMFVTHAPCLECAKLIYQSGIKSVFYKNAYRNTDGVEFLNKSNIGVHKI